MLILEKGSPASISLDAIRGLSALLVVLGHVRLMLIVDTSQVQEMTALTKLFYFLTNQGSSAVMVFFVLSGFLVGSSVIKDIHFKRWNWLVYVVARTSRIYVVLIPAIIIGITIDIAGIHFFGSSIVYSTPGYGVMLPKHILSNITPEIIVGNLFFLQEILVPTLGSNHPLWSLTNEVWYYIIFPFMVVAIIGCTQIHMRFFCGIFVIIALFLLPNKVATLFLVWLMRGVVALIPKLKIHKWHTVLVGLILFCWLAMQSMKLVNGSAYVTGLLTASLVYCFILQPPFSIPLILERTIKWLSNISYTLYLTHTPLVVFLAATLIAKGPKMQPTITGVGLTFLLTIIMLVYASILWFFFEKRTKDVKKWVIKMMGIT